MIVEESKKQRGRKKNTNTGFRPVAWSAAGMVDGKHVMERFYSPSGLNVSKEEVANFSAETVKTLFKKKHLVDPMGVDGPFLDFKGTLVKSSKKREMAVELPPSELNFTGETKPAIHKGWKGVAFKMADREDVMFYVPEAEVPPSLDPKKSIKPKAAPISVSALSFELSP